MSDKNMRAGFLIIGAMKSASSTVCKYLESHPSVFIKPGVEPSFFCDDERYARGTEWYEAEFGPGEASLVWGEGSNHYSMEALHPLTVSRIHEYSQDLKLVFLVRHPVDRIRSAWIQRRADAPSSIAATLDEAVRENYDFLVDPSKYWKQVSAYRRLFPRAQIHVGFMEDLKADSQVFFQEICTFLGIEAKGESELHMNPSSKKRVVSNSYVRFKSNPVVRTLKFMAPTGLRSWVRKRFFTVSAKEVAGFSEDSLAFLREELRADMDQFLEYCNRPRDMWAV